VHELRKIVLVWLVQQQAREGCDGPKANEFGG
jgi:hypothetical protein